MQKIGKIIINGKEKEIYLEKEKEFYKYYILEHIGAKKPQGIKVKIFSRKEQGINQYYYLKLIGVYSPKIPGETIIFRQDTIENSISAEIKDNNLTEIDKKKIKKYLEEIKVVEKIEKMQTNKRETTKEKEQKTNKTQNTTKDINIKQEVNLDAKVTDMSDLGQVLKKNQKIPKMQKGDKPVKMGIVESDDIKKLRDENGNKEQGHFSRYETVVITKKGKVQKLDLENDTQEGNNPSEKNYQVKQNDEVQKGDVLTRLKVGEGTVGIEKGQYGEVEIYHSQRKTIGGKGVEGNKSLDRQLETSNSKNAIEGTNIEMQKLAQEHNDGYRSVEESYQEAKKHDNKQPKCEKKEIKDLDGDVNTQSHTHQTEEYVELSTGEKVTYNQLASRWGFYKDGKPDSNYVKEKFEQKNKNDKKPEEVIGELDEEFEDPRINNQRT